MLHYQVQSTMQYVSLCVARGAVTKRESLYLYLLIVWRLSAGTGHWVCWMSTADGYIDRKNALMWTHTRYNKNIRRRNEHFRMHINEPHLLHFRTYLYYMMIIYQRVYEVWYQVVRLPATAAAVINHQSKRSIINQNDQSSIINKMLIDTDFTLRAAYILQLTFYTSIKMIEDTVFTLRAAYKLQFTFWRASSKFWCCGSYITSEGQISNSTCHQC